MGTREQVPAGRCPYLVNYSFVFKETPKRVLLKTVKTKMKCSIMLHCCISSGYTMFVKIKKDLNQTKENNIT